MNPTILVDKILSDILSEMSITELENMKDKVLPMIIAERKFRDKVSKWLIIVNVDIQRKTIL